MNGRLEAIWLKRFKRGPMDPVQHAELLADRGLTGNTNLGGRRQVTIIEQGCWQQLMRELNASLPPSTRRANLMLSGVSLRKSRGALLHIGECLLEIGGEVKPCERMEEALPGLKQAMYADWRGGVFARVLRGGSISVGDAVELQSANIELFEA
jgi:MOSC domain-containing protein YiiM